MALDSLPLFYCGYLSLEFKLTDTMSAGFAYACQEIFSTCK